MDKNLAGNKNLKDFPQHSCKIKRVLVINVIISYDNFIAIDPMKKFGARFTDFHRQKFSRQQESGLREKNY